MSYNNFSRGSRGSSFHGGGGRSRYPSQRPSRRFDDKENINPSRFVKQAVVTTEVNEFIPKNSFEDFDVEPILKKNLQIKGISAPSPIQDQTIPLGLEGKDIVGIANTGTGKTIAFALPILNSLMNFKGSKALIMAPTRELAQQIEDECRAIAKGSGIFGALLIGGSSMGHQLGDLRHNPSLVIGTPGRIKDHLERGSLDLAGFNMIVLDEVDRMLDMGFVQDMRDILSRLADERQSFFFSATMDFKVRNLISEFSNDPVMVSVKTGDTVDSVEQNVVTYKTRLDKVEKLHDLLNDVNVVKALVFDETQRSVEGLSQELRDRGFKTDAIHGGKSQSQRQRALNRFKASDINVLVATDVAARGIDVADITHVINYSVPKTYTDYTHRIGRAGRAGRTGYALTFIER
jgi:ATP-dependent RNA helicase RhlE